jgi:hypothetical protein
MVDAGSRVLGIHSGGQRQKSGGAPGDRSIYQNF